LCSRLHRSGERWQRALDHFRLVALLARAAYNHGCVLRMFYLKPADVYVGANMCMYYVE
jgi:hypothetical protein